MNAYFEDKLTDLEKESNPEAHLRRLTCNDVELRKKWEHEQSINYSYFQTIKTNNDVIDLIDRFDWQVSFAEDRVPYGAWIAEDTYNMALAEYRALQGLRKMAKFIDKGKVSQVEFAPLSEAEIDNLFDRMKGIILRMNKQNGLRGMQDHR